MEHVSPTRGALEKHYINDALRVGKNSVGCHKLMGWRCAKWLFALKKAQTYVAYVNVHEWQHPLLAIMRLKDHIILGKITTSHGD